jgi:hypothetical protein
MKIDDDGLACTVARATQAIIGHRRAWIDAEFGAAVVIANASGRAFCGECRCHRQQRQGGGN